MRHPIYLVLAFAITASFATADARLDAEKQLDDKFSGFTSAVKSFFSSSD